MKKTLIIYCFLVASFNTEASEEPTVEQQWVKFQEKFDKSYRSPIETRRRFTIFKENLAKIQQNNALYKEGKSKHIEGINQFTDWSSEEFLNYIKNGYASGRPIISKVFQKAENSKLPQYVDWRKKSAVTEVKNQGQLGSSWCFSATGAIEGQIGLAGNLVSLSEQNLVDCVSDGGSRGGSVNEAFDYVRKNGIESEVAYPNIKAIGTCHADPSKIVTKISNIVKIPQNDEEALQQAIAIAGPVSVDIDATESLQRYGSGIFSDDHCSNDTVNHAVLAVGYGSENGIDYYIIKNSWGKWWGENGYFRLSRNKDNMCGVASIASYPLL